MVIAQESRRLHVLMIAPFYPSRHDEADGCFVAESVEYLSGFNIDFTIISVKPWSLTAYKVSDRAPKAIWVRFPYIPTRFGWAGWGLSIYACIAFFVRRLHRQHKIDLIHAHCAVPCGHPAAILARRLRIPLVVTSHGLDVFCKTVKGLAGRWCERSSRLVYQSANQNICVSEAVRRAIFHDLSSARATVVHNGVDTTLFAPPARGEESATPTILSVGRLVPDKGQEVILRSIPALIKKYPDLRYVSIDDGPDRSRLVKLAGELKIADRVEFLGRQGRREIAAAMRRCTVFALPSRNEALGCVYLEAMATGKAVIACRNQGIEDIIRHGENGWLIGADNPDEMVQALDILLENDSLRRRLGEEARKTAVDKLALIYQARRLNQEYRECLDQLPARET
jgi:glycosyltransferase involved in cell wall biosynthesis